jgi:hypothetical protein
VGAVGAIALLARVALGIASYQRLKGLERFVGRGQAPNF